MLKVNRSFILSSIVFGSSIAAWYYTAKYLQVAQSVLPNSYLSAIAATLVIYVASLLFKNVSLYDTYWGLQGALYALTYLSYAEKPWANFRLIVNTLITLFWSLRLFFLFMAYSWNDIYEEDWRYRTMRLKANDNLKFSIRSGIMHYFLPMNIGFFGHVPFYYIINATESFNFIDFLAILISVSGVLIEAVADYQLRSGVYRQKMNTSMNRSGTDENKCMNTGLWALCRHPNYFGEYLYWLGLFITGLGAGARLYEPFYLVSFVIGSTLVYLVLNYVSIPLMEKRQLKRRTVAYTQYMKNVPYSFFPLNVFPQPKQY